MAIRGIPGISIDYPKIVAIFFAIELDRFGKIMLIFYVLSAGYSL